MTAQFTPASRARLDATIAALERAGVAHMVPILHAVRDCGVAYITLTQGDQRVSLPDLSTRPWIAIIGDDTDRAVGPNGFSPAALATLAAGANAAIVVAGAPEVGLYASAAALAAMDRNAIVVETRPDQEIAWTRWLQDSAPAAAVLVSAPPCASA